MIHERDTLKKVDAGGIHIATWRSMQTGMLDRIQSDLSRLADETAELQQCREEIIGRLQEQNQKVKSWEKLTDRFQQVQTKENESRELKEADDGFLARQGRR